ncbi:MAG: phage tail protein [Burkholderiales bacterium]|jgi:hypothetical protein
MSGSKPSLGTTEPRLGGLRVQTSLYGQTIPVVYGRARVPGNLLWYGDFQAIRQEERAESAKGGGGGSRPTRSYYEYSASVAMLLAEGPVAGVRTVYKGKQKFSGQATTATQSTAQYAATVPAGAPYTVTLPGSPTWVADAGVVYGKADFFDVVFSTGAYDVALVPGVDYTASGGVYTFNSRWAGYGVTITYTASTTTASVEALSQLGLALAQGTPNQAVWQYLQANFPNEAVPYANLAYVRGQGYSLTSAAEVENHTFEIDGFLGETSNGDAKPWKVIRDMLTNPRYGRGWLSAYLGDWSSFDAYCQAYGLVISPAFLEQRPLRAWLSEMLDALNTDAAWTGGVLKLIPRGDENAGSYVAPTTPVFDLGPDDFITVNGSMPVTVTRSAQQDIPNVVTVEYANRARDYNFEPVTAEDEADIAVYGKNGETAQTWHFFADSQAAKTAAFLRLQRLRAVRCEYAFQLPWRFEELEPGDLVTLTEPWLGLSKLPARVTQVTETPSGDFDVKAEDWPIGHATAPVVAPQIGSGFRPDYNLSPGAVATPMFIEPPGGYTAGGLEVWVAVSGQAGTPGQYWGGADVYASLDGGTSYKLVGRVDQGARYGTLTGALAAGSGATLPVGLAGRGGTLRTVSANEADAMATLLFVGSAGSGEFLSFQNAALTGAGAYNLTGLRRGRFSTTDQAAASGAQWAYVDGALATSGPLADDMVGKTILFKFCSFNCFGGGLQQLADVTPYSYTVTGRFRSAQAAIVSANWLENSAFTNSTEGWTLSPTNANLKLYHLNASTFAPWMLSGTPAGQGSGFVIQEDGDRPANGLSDAILAQWDKFYPVVGGDRIEGSAYLSTHRCPVDLRVAFYTANGAYHSEQALWGPGHAAEFAPIQSLANYARVGGFATVPAGVTRAMLFFRKYARDMGVTADGSFVFGQHAYLGPALPGQTVLSPWVEGPLRVVNTADLAAGAATTIAAVENGPGARFDLSTLFFVDYSLANFTATADGTVEISVTFDLSATGGVVAPNVITGGIYIGNGKLPLVSRTLMTAPTGANVTEVRTLTATVNNVRAGDTIAPLLRIGRSVAGFNIGNTTDRFYAVSSRVTHIKR